VIHGLVPNPSGRNRSACEAVINLEVTVLSGRPSAEESGLKTGIEGKKFTRTPSSRDVNLNAGDCNSR